MDVFTARASFDMFSADMFGQLMQTADPAASADPKHRQYCEDVRYSKGPPLGPSWMLDSWPSRPSGDDSNMFADGMHR